MFAAIASNAKWAEVFALIALIVFAIGCIATFVKQISVEFTFFLFLGLAFAMAWALFLPG